MRKQGHTPVNPAWLGKGLEYKNYIDMTLELLKHCDAIYMLDGWEKSKGAMFEHTYARTVGMDNMYQNWKVRNGL